MKKVKTAKTELEKVYIDLPNHWAVGGESLWAKSLGNDLYEIHNVPFYAYGLSYFDVVQVDSSSENLKPQVLKVVEYSGYTTLRIVFEDFNEDFQTKLFEQLKSFKAEIERNSENYVAVLIEPDGDYDGAYDLLTELEKAGNLEFETCEARNLNDFDVADKS